MDNEVLTTKLESLILCINRIKSQRVSSVEELTQDVDKQDIIILNL